MAVKDDGTVWAWGLNDQGQLGDGTSTNSNLPVQVSGLTGVTSVAGGAYYHSLALKNDGTVWGWGYGFYGQLGNGANANSSVPVEVLLTGVTAIAAGGHHSLALLSDGTVRAWGQNEFGTLGDGTNTDSNTPVPSGSLSGITAIASPVDVSLAPADDGTVWAWGRNFFGEFGDGTTTGSNVPVAVSAFSNISAIAGGEFHTLALKNDGTVWGCGRNFEGQLGNGTNLDSTVPTQVTGLCTVAGVEETPDGSAFAVYPDPTPGPVTVEWPQFSSATELVGTATRWAREVLRTTTTGARTTIDPTAQPAGMYHIAMHSGAAADPREADQAVGAGLSAVIALISPPSSSRRGHAMTPLLVFKEGPR